MVLSTFSFLDPPRISLELFESRRNKLETSSGLRNFGAKFSSANSAKYSLFGVKVVENGLFEGEKKHKISPQNSEAPMRFQAYSFEIQRVQVISWGGGQGTRKCSEPLKHDFLAHFGRSEVFWPKR